jgi:hypothetical protein
MSTNTFPVAALLLPRRNKPLLAFARSVHDHLAGNPSFPSPRPTLAVFAADIDAFAEAETKAETKTLGTAQERDIKKKKVTQDLAHLRDYVQSVVEAQETPRDGVALIESAFMSVKRIVKPSKPELSARNTEIAGAVELQAKAVGPVATYYWQYSLDQETWISAPDTMHARQVIAGLVPAMTYYFRFRALTKTREIGFSQAVSLFVH